MTAGPCPRRAIRLEDGDARLEALRACGLREDPEGGIAITFGRRRAQVGQLLRQLEGGPQVTTEAVAGSLDQCFALTVLAIPVAVDAVEPALGQRNDERRAARVTGPGRGETTHALAAGGPA